MLCLLLLLSGLGRLISAGHHSEAALLQVTVPQRTRTNASAEDASETHVTYLIKIEGKTYSLLLTKQSFLHPHFLVYSYNQSGALYPDSSFTQGHCFYRGYAAEIPKSIVTLNICSGLRGLLQFESISYGIEPLETSSTYEHMLYQIKDNKINHSLLQENYPMTQYADQSDRILVKSEKNADALLKRTLKIQIIVDKGMYDYMGSEVAVAAEKVVHIFGLINTMFSQLNVTVMLSSLELWSDQNKISTNGDADEVLQRFLLWKRKFLFQRSHDMAYLLVYRDHPNYVGVTYHGMACDPKFAAGVALYPKTITLEAFSVVMVQLLGINLGLTYDDIYNCYCLGTTCIMNPEAIQSRGVKFFSSCSIDGFKQVISQPELECLQNQPVSKVTYQGKSPLCGNRIVESNEQCDCGPPKECSHKKCCNPVECTLIGFAECGTGTCCDRNTCKIGVRGRLCRKSQDLCDLPEYCNGTSEFCVPDVKTADLELCNNDTAYCYGGICQEPDKQCVELFGKFAKVSSYLCGQEINFLNDKFGNCNQRCDFRHILCGKIVCHWTHSVLIPIVNYDLQYTFMGGQVCVSAHLRNTSKKDITYTNDGTMCGKGKFCKKKQCLAVEGHKNLTLCDSKVKCQGHGVCNDHFNCHCDVGYSPPTCEPAPSSPGGSIDDGYWVATDRSPSLLVKQQAAPRKNGLLISFYIFLPFLILTAIVALKWNKMKGIWSRVGTVSSESPSEDSSRDSAQSYT